MGFTLEQMRSWFDRPQTDAGAIHMNWNEFRMIADEFTRLRSALERIADLPPGSKGAYGKFQTATSIASDALKPQ